MNDESFWTEVSQEEFYRVIGPQNVNGRVVNDKYPYTTHMLTPRGQMRGKRVGYYPEGSAIAEYRHYLPATS